MKRVLFALMAVLPVVAIAADPCSFHDRDRARWTHADMVSWKTALAAYKQDNGKYPDVKSLEGLRASVEPMYIAHAPMVDAWGRAYAYEGDAGDFKIVSAGADGKFDRKSWSEPGKNTSYEGDAVVTGSSRWLSRSWDLSK